MLKKWKLLDLMMMILACAYLVLCVVFVGLFLAQVQNAGKNAFFTSLSQDESGAKCERPIDTSDARRVNDRRDGFFFIMLLFP